MLSITQAVWGGSGVVVGWGGGWSVGGGMHEVYGQNCSPFLYIKRDFPHSVSCVGSSDNSSSNNFIFDNRQ